MNKILYRNREKCRYDERCRCKEKEEFLLPKKTKSTPRNEGKPLEYQEIDGSPSQTFHIKYEKKLSSTAKTLLNSFSNKYIYYAIDDIFYLFKTNSTERNNLLALLYSPILSLQNNFFINFFDIWIREVYIEEISKPNKFLKSDSQTSASFSYITIKLFYKTSVPVKKQEPLW